MKRAPIDGPWVRSVTAASSAGDGVTKVLTGIGQDIAGAVDNLVTRPGGVIKAAATMEPRGHPWALIVEVQVRQATPPELASVEAGVPKPDAGS